ncbi:unnamed protein product [Brassicogethes aeneus]|uniref:Protein lingerer n=1 Tax=Brassicogethes aeneus TaxID=1431903 RepID=A0A9P0FED8_BRAAE|nr:unnamed protein product [Brassicogethes aeneus]
MSSGTRTTSKGGKGAKIDKSHKTDKGDVGKGSGDKQQRDTSTKSEDISMSDKVKLLIDLSSKTEDEVCLALHDCDNDMQQAINMLLEDQGTGGEWCVKKKKSRQASTSKGDKGDEGSADDWNDLAPASAGDKENNNSNYKSRGGRDGKRGGGGGPPRLHDRHNDNRGWRGRENGGDDWNSSGGRGGGERRGGRGGGGGAPRGGGGGRGRGGGRAGGGRYGPRGGSGRSDRGGGGGGGSFNKPFDTWDNSNTWDNNTVANTNHNAGKEENWDDFPGADEWTTEEYTGSLADTKVFTPSTQQNDDPNEQQMQPPEGAVPPPGQEFVEQPGGIMSQSPVPIVGTLNAAQTQYLSQLTQQNSESMNKQYATATGGGGASPSQTYQQQQQLQSAQTQQAAPAQQQTYAGTAQTPQYGNAAAYNSAYPATGANSYDASAQQQAQQPPARTKTQRARVPPPSKIPSSAVEMPGEMNSFQYLDVQFGAMDFMDGGGGGGATFDATSVDANPKYATSASNNLESTGAPNAQQDSSADNTYASSTAAKNQTQSSISSALSQSLSSTDNIPQTGEHLTTGSYSAASRGGANASAQSQQQGGGGSGGGMDQMSQKGAADANTYSQQASYNSYQSKTNNYNSSSNYAGVQTTTSSYVSGQSNNYVNSQSAATAGSGNNAYQASAGAGGNTAANSYSNAYSSGGGNSTGGGYQGGNSNNAFPTISQANSYPNNQTYPQNTSQSVYGANTGLSNSSGYGQTSSASQYNNYGSSASAAGNKLKENSYDGTGSSASAAANSGGGGGGQSTANNVTSATALSSLSQTTTAASAKSTTTLAAKNSNSVVSNIPPGVAPVMSTPYIMGQVPYFQQPVYSYEDMQLLQQRLPHMTTPYYDMSYQTPTTLAAVRDASGLGNVGYSMSSDGRFARGGDNASPVPSTLSQQQTSTLTQGHQAQPILAGGAPPYFFAATAFNTIAPNYQFGTMYTQLPAATNAHGTNSSSQYPKPGAGYSGYGTYDPLGQTQEYGKGGYASSAAAAAQAQKGGGGGGNASTTGSAGNDLSAMYGKSHAALGKVNSYEKQGFHSGTPPPFTGTLHGSQSAGLAPSGTGYGPQVYIPTMAPHQQHHSTPLMHQPHMQDSGNSSGQRSQGSNQAKAGSKQNYPNSYWNQS